MINQSSELWLFFNFHVYSSSSSSSHVSTLCMPFIFLLLLTCFNSVHAIYQPSSSTCKFYVIHILCNRTAVQNLITDCAICRIKYCILRLSVSFQSFPSSVSCHVLPASCCATFLLSCCFHLVFPLPYGYFPCFI